MKTQKSTFGVIFYLRKYKAVKSGRVPIYARITVNGRRTDLSVKRSVEPANWNEHKGMAKGSREEISKLNKYLEEYRAGIVDAYQELQLKKKLITAELVKDKFSGEDQSEFTLCKLMDYHNIEEVEVLEQGTIKNYFTTQKYVKEFLWQHYKTSDKYLSELTYKFITEFEVFLRKRKPEKGQRPLANNGIMKHLERFCKMINLAVRLEWIERNPFHAYRLKFEKVERRFLTKLELQRIEDKQFDIFRLQLVKDLFIFSCYTGLAYRDVFNLLPENLVEWSADNFWLISSRQKTSVAIKVPLLPKALAIIGKYNEHPQTVNSGKLLPPISNQKLNSYLKEIADLCSITKPLTFHIARHTFATTIALTNKVPIETVSKLLSHTKISTTQIYAKVVETKLREDMDELRQKLMAG
ncbi:site-specific integrase [Mucilaginibacter terrae]|uniref:Integrase n=1 Tax=Mucilaginibacter terrae TaxID=1955052 RepID=A0ABU3GV04_9SPHI|nr:site-specific integrase [Mucilaginibacter terrae]MDT3403598.1 integrase [Mucilaginibacter terrae]